MVAGAEPMSAASMYGAPAVSERMLTPAPVRETLDRNELLQLLDAKESECLMLNRALERSMQSARPSSDADIRRPARMSGLEAPQQRGSLTRPDDRNHPSMPSASYPQRLPSSTDWSPGAGNQGLRASSVPREEGNDVTEVTIEELPTGCMHLAGLYALTDHQCNGEPVFVRAGHPKSVGMDHFLVYQASRQWCVCQDWTDTSDGSVLAVLLA